MLRVVCAERARTRCELVSRGMLPQFLLRAEGATGAHDANVCRPAALIPRLKLLVVPPTKIPKLWGYLKYANLSVDWLT